MQTLLSRAIRSLHTRAALLLVCTAGVAPFAQAQVVQPERSPALRCLQHDPAQPTEPIYPFNAFKRGESGRVQVELSFTVATGRPAVEVIKSEGDSEFVGAVRDYVRHLRLPCLDSADVPVRLRQEYVFEPALKRASWGTEDLADTTRAELSKCVKHPRATAPDYPAQALYKSPVGRIYANLFFTGADQPPEIELWAFDPQGSLAQAVRKFAQGMRMPCYAGKPFKTTLTFVFKPGVAGREYGFKPLTLQTYLGRVKRIREQTLSFDFNEMSCPFDLQLLYLRPGFENKVKELGPAVMQRKPFLDWLRQTELDLPSDTLESVYGDTALISVPCTKLNLNPKAAQ